MTNQKITLVSVLLFICSLGTATAGNLTNLKVNRMTDPTGISRTARFTWEITSKGQDLKQVAYAVSVASKKGELWNEDKALWASEKITSSETLEIPYQGRRLPAGAKLYWQAQVWLNNGEHIMGPVRTFETAPLAKDLKAKWIGDNRAERIIKEDQGRQDLPARYMRREFTLDRKPLRAMLYVSYMGYGAGYINGKEVSQDVFGTIQTDYEKTVYYNTYDVTKLLKAGRNAIGLVLGNGYCLGLRDNHKLFGMPRAMAQLVVETARDTFVIATDQDWKMTTEGPITRNNLYDGEAYDARKEQKGWTSAGFDDRLWEPAQLMPTPLGNLIPQPCPGFRTQDEVKPISIRQTGEGKYLVDMGQNMVGQLRVSLQGEEGQAVILRHAETLNPQDSTQLYMANLRTARCTNTYIPSTSGKFTYQPLLVYQGFRYVEISGVSEAPRKEDITGCVQYDEMSDRSSFLCDNELLNQLHHNAYWGIRGNYHGMPTDCPQRDERMGWTGDRVTGCYGENILFDNQAFYYKWLRDLQDVQKENGQLCNIAPSYWLGLHADNVTWTGAMTYVTYMLYRRHGDMDAVRTYYPSLRKWAEYTMKVSMKEGIMTIDTYGDWCMPPERADLIHSEDPARRTEGAVLSTTVFYDCLRMLSEMATAQNITADALYFDRIAKEMKEAYNKRFFNDETAQYANNTVTANILSLQLGLVPEGYEERVLKNIVDVTEGPFNGHVSCGVLGIQHLMRGLTRRGHLDLAMKVVLQRTYPSYGYMIDHGATTIWELWNGNTADPAMNSGNHVMLLGDLLLWYYEDLAGIRQAEDSNGYEKLNMHPYFPDELNHVKAYHHSAKGPIRSEWEKEGDHLKWAVEIPVGTTAEVHIPQRFNISASTGRGIQKIENDEEGICLTIGSGKYVFQTAKP